MKKALVVFLLTCCGMSLRAQDKFYTAFSKINNEVQQHSPVYSNLKQASATIGHRLTGSANGAKAEEYAYKLLKSYGYKVKYQPFEVESWSRLSNTTKIGSSTSRFTGCSILLLWHIRR